jgi:iron complex transport system ATP-binding protein
VLEARDLSFSVNGNTLLRQVNTQVRPGRVTVLIGPNGAGKSTLLRVLSGEFEPTGGQALLDNRPLKTLPAAELARRRAVVPQSSVLAFPFTVLEVAMLGITVPGFQTSAAAQRPALDALDVVGMSALAGRLYVHLSGGERQRVHIARALCQLTASAVRAGETRCFLLDEPTSSLDLAHQSLVLDAVRRQAGLGLAVLAVMHDLNLAAALADDMTLLVRGEVAATGTPAEVLREDILSKAYNCPIYINRVPDRGRPYVLPPAAFLPMQTAPPARTRAAGDAADRPAAVHPPH